MIITIYSKDSYRRIKALKEIINSYLEKYSAYYRFDLPEVGDLGDIKSVLSTNSMFSDKKLIVIDNPFANKPKKELKDILKDTSKTKDTVIVLNTDKKIPAGLPFLKKEPNLYKEQEDLGGESLKRFILREAKELGVSLTQKDIDSLEETHGKDTWAIVKELEHASLRDTPKLNISSFGESFDYFKNLNTFRRGYSTEQRMTALENLLVGRKDEAARIFNGIAFRPSNEKEALTLASYDILVKSGKLDYEEVLLAIALDLELEPQEL